MNNSTGSPRVYYRERSMEPEFKKRHVVSVRIDDDTHEKLAQLRKLLL